jgi:ComF family protein
MDQEETRAYLPNILNAHMYTYIYACIKYYKGGIGQKLMQKIKYEHKPELALLMGYSLGGRINKIRSQIDMIIPVPLHKKKIRKRGYNQSDYFAQGISESTGVPWSPDIIGRVINNPSQTNKSRLERIRNVEGIFEIKDLTDIHDKSILLVDDVITTGATLSACAETLLNAGAHVTGIASIALARM